MSILTVDHGANIRVSGSFLYLYLLYLYPGFYSYAEGATWKILNLLTETLLITVSLSFV